MSVSYLSVPRCFWTPDIWKPSRSGIDVKVNCVASSRTRGSPRIRGVGENAAHIFKLHQTTIPLILIQHLADHTVETLNQVEPSRGEKEEIVTIMCPLTRCQLKVNDSGLDTEGRPLRPNAEELKELGPHFQKEWREYLATVVWIGPFKS